MRIFLPVLLYKKVITPRKSPEKRLVKLTVKFRLTIEESAKSRGVTITLVPQRSAANSMPRENGTPRTAPLENIKAAKKTAYKSMLLKFIFNGMTLFYNKEL